MGTVLALGAGRSEGLIGCGGRSGREVRGDYGAGVTVSGCK